MCYIICSLTESIKFKGVSCRSSWVITLPWGSKLCPGFPKKRILSHPKFLDQMINKCIKLTGPSISNFKTNEQVLISFRCINQQDSNPITDTQCDLISQQVLPTSSWND